jgi:hypothetical protein
MRSRNKDRSVESWNRTPEKQLAQHGAIFRINWGLIKWDLGDGVPIAGANVRRQDSSDDASHTVAYNYHVPGGD